MFKRWQLVMVRLRATTDPVEADVVVDVGGKTVVVDPYGDPARLYRVPRQAISDYVPRKVETPVKHGVVKRRSPPELTALSCLDTEHGDCAMQIQGRKLTKAEMVPGVWTMCDTWVELRTSAHVGEPTCPRCRKMLKMRPWRPKEEEALRDWRSAQRTRDHRGSRRKSGRPPENERQKHHWEVVRGSGGSFFSARSGCVDGYGGQRWFDGWW
jgi:hypothetical protein